MSTQPNTTGKKTYCVWADYIRRLYQHVEADSPEQARTIAESRPECWDDCSPFEDRDDYRVSAEVQDLATEEFTRVGEPTRCKTCGSEIVETINESHFRDGECGPCEHRRYRSQPALLDAAYISLGFVRSWEKERGVREPTIVRTSLEAGITQANGNAA